MGSWLTYGLGTENQNLPGFIVLCPGVPTTVGPPLWNSAFLPGVYQGTYIADNREADRRSIGKDFDPKKLIANIHNDKFTLTEQRRSSTCCETLNRMHLERERPATPQLEARIQSFETRLPDADRGAGRVRHPQGERGDAKLYGPGSTARGCLIARRLVERGVRIVQVYYGKGQPWDDHDDIEAAPQARRRTATSRSPRCSRT